MKKCYWCYKPLHKQEETRDHFISRSLWNHLRPALLRPALQSRSPSCVSCSACNNKRGEISALFHILHDVQRLRLRGKHKGQLKSFYKGKQKLRLAMLDFRQKIEEMEAGVVKTLCLREIDDIFWFNLDQEVIRSQAYFLWEQAGRPAGDGTQFWLAAERHLAK